MSSEISFPGGAPFGFAIFGRCSVSVETFAAIAFTAGVGGDGFGVVWVGVAVVVVCCSDGEPLGIAAVFVPPPQAASASEAVAAAIVMRNLGLITARKR